jgi:hypothetical protein
MKRVPFNLRALRAARDLRAGICLSQIQRDTGVNPQQLLRIRELYAAVPDELLERMERVLVDQDRLRSIIATLTFTLGGPSAAPSNG